MARHYQLPEHAFEYGLSIATFTLIPSRKALRDVVNTGLILVLYKTQHQPLELCRELSEQHCVKLVTLSRIETNDGLKPRVDIFFDWPVKTLEDVPLHFRELLKEYKLIHPFIDS